MGYSGRIADRPVLAVITGIGTALAHAATVRLLDAVDVDWVIVVGIAGAIDNQTPIGTLVLPELVVSGADGCGYRPKPLGIGEAATGSCGPPTSCSSIRWSHAGLRAQGVVALDMETASVAKVCEERGVTWSVVRAISDRAGDGSVDAEIAGLTRPDGRPNFSALARYLVSHRRALPRLIRLARGARLATEQAAETAINALMNS